MVGFQIVELATNKLKEILDIDNDNKLLLGNKIIKYIVNHYKINNKIFLTVDNNNIYAKKLYLKNGFKDIEINENYSLMKK